MPPAVIASGLACGLLLAGSGAALWTRPRPVPGVSRAARAIGWLASVALVVAAALSWDHDPGLVSRATRLFLIAAVAAPTGHSRRSRPAAAILMSTVTTLVLVCAGLLIAWNPAGAGPITTCPAPTSLGAVASILATVLCAGFGLRANSEALGTLVDADEPAVGSASTAYGLLTLLVGGGALASLLSRGTVWAGTPAEAGLTSAFLAWSAVWLSRRQHPRTYALLVVVAALLLLFAAMASV